MERARGQTIDEVFYKGIVQIKNSKGAVVATYYPEIVRAVQDARIITAYPSSRR